LSDKRLGTILSVKEMQNEYKWYKKNLKNIQNKTYKQSKKEKSL
jgi:hypothetical protein